MVALVMCMCMCIQWKVTDGKISSVIQTFENPSAFNALFMTIKEAASIRRGFFTAWKGGVFDDKDSAAAKEAFEKYCDPSITLDVNMPFKNLDIFKVYTGLNSMCAYKSLLEENFDFEGPYVGGGAMINVRQMQRTTFSPHSSACPKYYLKHAHTRSLHSD